MDLRLSLPPWATSGECDLDAALPVLLPPQHSLPCPCGWAGGARAFPEHPPPLCSHSRLPQGKRRDMEAQIRSEALTLLSNLADLANAVHWLPPGILWAGRFPPWLVGLLGTISSLLSMYQAVGAGGQAYAAPDGPGSRNPDGGPSHGAAIAREEPGLYN